MVNMKGQVVDRASSRQFRFEYRQALLASRHRRRSVASVEARGSDRRLNKRSKKYLHYRRNTQPLAMPSAGCVFKNPPNDSAGRLIEAVGLKGARVGDVGGFDGSMPTSWVNRGQSELPRT